MLREPAALQCCQLKTMQFSPTHAIRSQKREIFVLQLELASQVATAFAMGVEMSVYVSKDVSPLMIARKGIGVVVASFLRRL